MDILSVAVLQTCRMIWTVGLRARNVTRSGWILSDLPAGWRCAEKDCTRKSNTILVDGDDNDDDDDGVRSGL